MFLMKKRRYQIQGGPVLRSGRQEGFTGVISKYVCKDKGDPNFTVTDRP